MSNQISEAVDIVIHRLVALAAQDDELRTHLRSIAQFMLDSTADVLPPKDDGETVEESADQEVVDRPSASELIKQLWPSRVGTIPAVPVEPVPVPQSAATVIDTAELATIEKRCRLKAEGMRWSAERQRRIGNGVSYRNEIEPIDGDLIARAKLLPNCFLWMSHANGPPPRDADAWEDAAGCFDTLADAAALTKESAEERDQYPDLFESSLDLLAEAQSAVRVAVAAVDGQEDSDQKEAYGWLRAVAAHQQIFIQRYMRSTDVADSTTWEALAERIEAVDTELQEKKQQQKLRQRGLKRIAYVVKQIRTGLEAERDHQWRTLVATVDDLVANGLPPSHRELRDHILPVIDDWPDELETSQAMDQVLREIDRFLASQPEADSDDTTDGKRTVEVDKVAAALKEKTVVLIGGERRPHAEAALRDAFGLERLHWISTREHEAPDQFEPHVAKNGVAVVLLAIRWSSHSYGDVKAFCDKHGKHFVRLKAGYNPNQVAVHILDQCPGLFGE